MILFNAEHLKIRIFRIGQSSVCSSTRPSMLTGLRFRSRCRYVTAMLLDMFLTPALLQVSLGRISFTADLWTDPILRAFMAVTAHYIIRVEDRRLVLKGRLIAFKHIVGHHDGASLARAFFAVLEEEGVTRKVRTRTFPKYYAHVFCLLGRIYNYG